MAGDTHHGEVLRILFFFRGRGLYTHLMIRSGGRSIISVCAAPSDKHVFQLVLEGRMDERPLTSPGTKPADLVVFQAGQDVNFVNALHEFPDSLWTSARSRTGKVVFDASSEGRMHDPRTTDQLHAFLERAGVPLDQAVYVTQCRPYGDDYAQDCRLKGISPRMKIVVYDYWIRRVLGEYQEHGAQIFDERLRRFRGRGLHRDRRFLSLNYTPRRSKLIFLTRLIRDGLWDLGFVSFGGFDQMKRRKGKSLDRIKVDFLQMPGLEEQARSLLPFIDDLAGRGRILLGDVPERRVYKQILHADGLEEYDRSWFSAVTETEMHNHPCRITEKVLKPLLNFHPMVLFGNPSSLKLIHELGFETFPELVDETYDDVLPAGKRFELAFSQVERLCRMDEAQMADLTGLLAEKLEFNAKWGLTELPSKLATEGDEKFLCQVLAAARPEFH